MGAPQRALYAVYRGLARIVVPGLENSQYPYVRTLGRLRTPRARWLDLGCGRRPFPAWMRLPPDLDELARTRGPLVGVDPDADSLRDNRSATHRVRGDGAALPFSRSVFELVSANMVCEHVPEPDRMCAEVRRVLAPGGRFVLHTPNLESPIVRLAALLPDAVKRVLARLLEGRRAEDVFPTLYRMNTERRLGDLAASAGLEVIEIRHVDSTPTTARLGPLVLFELLWIRLLRLRPLRRLRTNLVVVLAKPGNDAPEGHDAGDGLAASITRRSRASRAPSQS